MEGMINTGEIRAASCTICDRREFLRCILTISREINAHIICFDADKMAGIEHARVAVSRAVRSFNAGCRIANTLEMEALLYAAGSRQTSVGSLFGIHEGENNMYISCCPCREGVWELLSPMMRFFDEVDPWDAIDPEKAVNLMKLFDILPKELSTLSCQTLQDLVLERVALLDSFR